MHIHRSPFGVVGVAGLILGAAVPLDSHAQTVTVLESFEDGLDAVTVVGGGNRGEEDIDLSLHTKAGDDDLAVTDGEKALQITIKNNLAWNADADITLSEEASDLVKQAWASKEEARYLLRFDVTFPEGGYNWGNFQMRVAEQPPSRHDSPWHRLPSSPPDRRPGKARDRSRHVVPRSRCRSHDGQTTHKELK